PAELRADGLEARLDDGVLVDHADEAHLAHPHRAQLPVDDLPRGFRVAGSVAERDERREELLAERLPIHHEPPPMTIGSHGLAHRAATALVASPTRPSRTSSRSAVSASPKRPSSHGRIASKSSAPWARRAASWARRICVRATRRS